MSKWSKLGKAFSEAVTDSAKDAMDATAKFSNNAVDSARDLAEKASGEVDGFRLTGKENAVIEAAIAFVAAGKATSCGAPGDALIDAVEALTAE